ncbi:hypothetical protein ACFWFQ_24995 [Nocardia salmonicida]|uniref:hypothetical protein n=1 Tax=Nocardia salmonicida TaxID=53431 RepID=UPI00365D7203
MVILLLDPSNFYFVLATLAAFGFSFGPIVVSAVAVRGGHPATRRRRAERRHQRAVRAWDRRQARRREAADAQQSVWQPVRLWSGAKRIDVFGGDRHGWTSLLTTFGATALRAGSAVVVVDFTNEEVVDPLVRLAGDTDHRAVKLEFPADLAVSGFLDGLSSDDVAEILAASLRLPKSAPEAEDSRALDAELIGLAAGQLAAPITFERLSLALRELRHTHDSSRSSALTDAEVERLVNVADTVGESDRNLQFLADELGYIARAATSRQADPGSPTRPATPGKWWDTPGLVVATCRIPHPRRRQTMERVLFERVLHELSNRSGNASNRVLVVVGANGIGPERLTELALQARRTGTRLITVMERLEGESRELIGTAHSVAILMQLGNDKDAAAAAEFIGRDHKFTLSQVSLEFSEQTNWSEADGATSGYSTSNTRGGSRPWNTFIETQKSRAVAEATNIGSSVTTTVGGGRNEGHGEVTSREYEFIVEPTFFQALPSTAFCLVEPTSAQRRIVFGDCDPSVVLRDGIAHELESNRG